jgi:hypothetical protein
MSKALKIAALIAFVLACFKVHFPIDFLPLGLALWVGSELI